MDLGITFLIDGPDLGGLILMNGWVDGDVELKCRRPAAMLLICQDLFPWSLHYLFRMPVAILTSLICYLKFCG